MKPCLWCQIPTEEKILRREEHRGYCCPECAKQAKRRKIIDIAVKTEENGGLALGSSSYGDQNYTVEQV